MYIYWNINNSMGKLLISESQFEMIKNHIRETKGGEESKDGLVVGKVYKKDDGHWKFLGYDDNGNPKWQGVKIQKPGMKIDKRLQKINKNRIEGGGRFNIHPNK